LGINNDQTKAVAGFQEALRAQGFTNKQADAIITDAVKDIKGAVYDRFGRIQIFNNADRLAIGDRIAEISIGRRQNRGAAQGEVDEKVKAAQIAEERSAKLAEYEKEHEKWLQKEQTKREKLLYSLMQRRVGDEAAAAYAAVAELDKATQKRNRLQQEYKDALATPGSLINGDAELADAKYGQALTEQLRLAEDAATTIQDAFLSAKESAKEAKEALRGAESDYAAYLTGEKKGIGQFLSRGSQARRSEAGRQLLLKRARQIRNEVLPTLGNADRTDFFNNTSNLGSLSAGQLQQFIEAAGGELEAQRNLTKANQDLTKANNNLAEVMRIAAEAEIPLVESNAALVTTIGQLVEKDWLVSINVPGGSASGDVVAMQNALS